MTTIEQIKIEWWRFCGVAGASRTFLQEPWDHDGWIYATDGRIVIRHVGQCGRVVGAPDDRQVRSIVDLFAAIDATTEFLPLGEITLNPSIMGGGGCAGCCEVGRVGPGRREMDDLVIGGEICKECQGTCYADGDRWIAQLGKQFVHGFYARSLATLPTCEWRPLDPDPAADRAIQFCWDCCEDSETFLGDGLLMPLAFENERPA